MYFPQSCATCPKFSHMNKIAGEKVKSAASPAPSLPLAVAATSHPPLPMNTQSLKACLLALLLVATVAAVPDTEPPTLLTIHPAPSSTLLNLRQIEVFF